MEWIILPSVGASRGILIIWDNRSAYRVDLVEGAFSLSVLLNIKGKGQWITSVYGPTIYRHRSLFWGSCHIYWDCALFWCLEGDFNAYKLSLEKLGGGCMTKSMGTLKIL